MRATTFLCAVAALTLGNSAMSAVSMPTIGDGTASISDAAPTGNSYVQVHGVPLTMQVMWMPKGGFNEFPLAPAGDGSVTLKLGATIRWDALPTNQWDATPNDMLRFFTLGYSTDGGANITWGDSYKSYYLTGGFGGTLDMNEAGKWYRHEREFTFNLQTMDGSTPVSWYYREERMLDVAHWGASTINPVDVSFDDLTIEVNGANVLSAGDFEYDQATLDNIWGFWQNQETSTQAIVAVPEPTSLALVGAPLLLLAARRRNG